MLRGTFEQIGHVTSAEVVCHAKSGRSKGWGTVAFSTRDEANDAILRFGGVELFGRPMTVMLATAVRKVCGRVGEGAMAGYVAPTCRTLEVPQEDGVDV